jgi:hypothetical protein
MDVVDGGNISWCLMRSCRNTTNSSASVKGYTLQGLLARVWEGKELLNLQEGSFDAVSSGHRKLVHGKAVERGSV